MTITTNPIGERALCLQLYGIAGHKSVQHIILHLRALDEAIIIANKTTMVTIDSFSSLTEELSKLDSQKIETPKHKMPFWTNDWRRK